MPTQLELQSDMQVFTTVMNMELHDRDRSMKGGWKSDTRLEMLAHEIVRYMPELADLLVAKGKQKLAA
ncbi:MAG: hypothetical protein ABL974_19325 [Prosthecobacter sp.]